MKNVKAINLNKQLDINLYEHIKGRLKQFRVVFGQKEIKETIFSKRIKIDRLISYMLITDQEKRLAVKNNNIFLVLTHL